MTELFPVNSMRGITLPEGIIPDFMFQIGGDDCLIVQDVKGRLFARKGQRWYKMVEFKVKELVEETLEVTHAPVDPTPEPTIPETAIRLMDQPPEGGSTPATASPSA
jgi:hypothetical protein